MAGVDYTKLSPQSCRKLELTRAHGEEAAYREYQKWMTLQYDEGAYDYPTGPEKILYRANKCRSIYNCVKCNYVVWVDRLYPPKDVTIIGHLQNLTTVDKQLVYCTKCTPKPTPQVITTQLLTSEELIKIKGLRVYTEHSVCKCRSCQRFTLDEAKEQMVSLNNHRNK